MSCIFHARTNFNNVEAPVPPLFIVDLVLGILRFRLSTSLLLYIRCEKNLLCGSGYKGKK